LAVLADLTFIDSAGLGVLNIARTQALHRRINLVLHDVPLPVDRVLEISGTHEVFRVSRTSSRDAPES
jgi:anti-anti-sigma factor